MKSEGKMAPVSAEAVIVEVRQIAVRLDYMLALLETSGPPPVSLSQESIDALATAIESNRTKEDIDRRDRRTGPQGGEGWDYVKAPTHLAWVDGVLCGIVESRTGVWARDLDDGTLRLLNPGLESVSYAVPVPEAGWDRLVSTYKHGPEAAVADEAGRFIKDTRTIWERQS